MADTGPDGVEGDDGEELARRRIGFAMMKMEETQAVMMDTRVVMAWVEEEGMAAEGERGVVVASSCDVYTIIFPIHQPSRSGFASE